MLKNYLNITLRTIRRRPAHFAINVLGLSLGLACCIVMVLFVRQELSYDRHNEHAEDIFRLVRNTSALTAAPMGPALEATFPGILRTARVLGGEQVTVSVDPAISFAEKVFFADPAYFDIFDHTFIAGDPASALSEPTNLVITRSAAEKYFGDVSAVGETLTLYFEEPVPFTVAGVIEDQTASHFQFELMGSFELVAAQSRRMENWQTNWLFTYGLLAPGASLGEIERQLPDFFSRNAGEAWDFFRLQPLLDIHLHSRQFSHDIAPQGNIFYVYLFGAMAFLILLIACINFTNLSTARSMQRAREIGVRKVMGAGRNQLIRQFFGETFIAVLFAMLAAAFLAYRVLPIFETFTGAGLTQTLFEDSKFVGLFLLVLGVIVTGFAGGYPALILSSFNPVKSIKGDGEIGRSGWIRTGLVVFQFTASVLLIVGALTINRQLNFVREADLGFEREQVMFLEFREELETRYQTIKHAVLQHPDVLKVSAAGTIPGRDVSDFIFGPEGFTDIESLPSMDAFFVDADYTDVLGIQVIEGRPFLEDRGSDSNGFLINETALQLIRERSSVDWSDPIGKQLDFYLPGASGWEVYEQGHVVGVVKDFNYQSMHARIGPLVMHIFPQAFGYLLLKVNTDNLPATLAFLEETWADLGPDRPFTYTFLDEQFDQLYRSEARMASIFSIFSGLAILIACLGLLGLTSLSTSRRIREIGVRKVLGASSLSIVHTLTFDYMKLVLIAFLVAIPVAFFALNWWLASFAYRVDFSWGLMVLTGLTVLSVAWICAASQSVWTAMLNPVIALKHE